jgi:ABC-type multidrug transport system fused ATPase/permease subunit
MKSKSLRVLASFAKPYRFWIIVSIISSIALVIFNLLKVYYITELIQYALKGQVSKILNISLILLVIVLVGILATYFAKYATNRLGTGILCDLKQRIAERLEKATMASIKTNHSGDLISRVNNDLFAVGSFFEKDFTGLLYQPLLFVGSFVYILAVEWRLLLCLTVTPLMIFLMKPLRKSIGKYSRQFYEELGEANIVVKEALNHISTVKAYNLEKTLQARNETVLRKSVQSGTLMEKYNVLLLPFIIIMNELPYIIYTFFGGYLVLKGRLAPGAFIAFIQLLGFLISPLATLPQLIGNLSGLEGAVERLSAIIALPVERNDGRAFPVNLPERVLEFNHVSFSYHEDQPLLKNLNFKIRQGEIIGLVGPSGSGKTTITNLIGGFYEPTVGSIYLYGHDLREWSLSAIRAKIAVVTQDTYLSPGTIAENILYGSPGATFTQITSAAKMANAHEFILNTRDGYNTIVGEGGIKLSGGQHQRVALARAILKDTPILLLDEPTSALDNESEELIREALERFVKNRAVIIIAHRLTTIKKADKILSLNQGNFQVKEIPPNVAETLDGV